MNSLTFSASMPLTMSSREIADLTGKEHKHVLRDIRAMLDELAKDGPVLDHPREDTDGRGYTAMFHLNRELTDTLLTGYSVVLRRKVVARWHELEGGMVGIPKTFAEALRLAAAQAETNEGLQLQIEQQQPAVEFVDRYVEARSDKGLREVAKILGIKERDFIAELARTGVIFKQGANWLPYAEHQHAGRFTVKTGEANGHAFHQMRFTPDGVAWVARRFSKQKEAA